MCLICKMPHVSLLSKQQSKHHTEKRQLLGTKHKHVTIQQTSQALQSPKNPYLLKKKFDPRNQLPNIRLKSYTLPGQQNELSLKINGWKMKAFLFSGVFAVSFWEGNYPKPLNHSANPFGPMNLTHESMNQETFQTFPAPIHQKKIGPYQRTRE